MNGLKKRKAIIILFLTALIVRLSILVFFDDNRISPDGDNYHNSAVNIAKGNGYSKHKEAPFDKYYFREPGYPHFLAGIYSIVNVFTPVQYIGYHDPDTKKLDKIYPEIIIAKIIQIILDSVSMILIFLIIIEISNIKIAFLTSLSSALFLNLAFISTYMLRECLVFFLLLLLNFFYIKYLKTEKKFLWLILMGIITGFLVLTFQVHVVLLPVLFVLLLICLKNLKKTIVHFIVITVIAFIVITPHLLNVYMYYPDIKILKTLGTSFTHELYEYSKTVGLLQSLKIISGEETSQLRDWGVSSKIQFERSFSGYYKRKTESLKALLPEKDETFSSRIKHRLKVYYKKFRKSFFLTKIGFFSGKYLIDKYSILILLPLVFFPFLIGFTGIIGLLIFWRKYLVYLLPFTAYLSVFWLLGSEYRRMIILQPFLIFFGLLLINKILMYFNIHWLTGKNIESKD